MQLLLLISFAKINFSIFQDLHDKKTPVVLASEENRWELVQFLFTKGADLNIGTRANKKPIHYACSSNNSEMVKWLFEHGAEPNQKLNNGSNEKKMTTDVNVSNFSFRRNRPEVSVKKGVLRNFAKFTGKHLCHRLFFNKVIGFRPATLFKKSL